MSTTTTTTSSTEPRLYVGTYAKYNTCSIGGAWLTLSDYASREDFLAACRELHKDEAQDDDAPPPFAVSLRRPQAAKSEPVEPVNNSDFADGFKIGTGIKV